MTDHSGIGMHCQLTFPSCTVNNIYQGRTSCCLPNFTFQKDWDIMVQYHSKVTSHSLADFCRVNSITRSSFMY